MTMEFETFKDAVDLTEWVNKNLCDCVGRLELSRIVSIVYRKRCGFIIFYTK